MALKLIRLVHTVRIRFAQASHVGVCWRAFPTGGTGAVPEEANSWPEPHFTFNTERFLAGSPFVTMVAPSGRSLAATATHAGLKLFIAGCAGLFSYFVIAWLTSRFYDTFAKVYAGWAIIYPYGGESLALGAGLCRRAQQARRTKRPVAFSSTA